MWIKNLRHKKLQSIMIFLIIAVCTTLLSGAMSILTSLDKPTQDFAKSCKTATAKIFPYITEDSAAYEMGEQFAKLAEVKAVEYGRSYYIGNRILFQGKKLEAFSDLTEYNDKIFGSDRYLEGSKNAALSLSDKECILPASISNQYDIHIGDTITVQLEDRDLTYTVAAVYSDPYQTSTAFNCDILVKQLPTMGELNIYVYGKEQVTGNGINEAYREANGGRLNGFIFTIEDRTDNGLVVGRIIGAIFLAIGIIMLLVSGLMIYYMIRNVMITDEKSIAVYKTLGYTSGDILAMYLKMYFAIVTAACTLGILCSVVVSNNVLSSIFENMGQLKVNNPYLSGVVCYVVTAGFVIAIIAAIISRTKRVKPVLALSGYSYGGIKKKQNYRGNSSLQFSAFGIACRTFLREKKNALSIIITCIVTIFSVNFIVISLDVASEMKENNDYWIGVDKSDVMIDVPEEDQFDLVKNSVMKDERVDHYLSNRFDASLTLDWQKGSSLTDLRTFIYDDYKASRLPVTEGRNPEAGDEMAISTTAAAKLHKKIGDYLTVYINNDKKADFLITGLFQSYYELGDVCRITTAAFRENDCELSYNNLSVYLKNKKDTESFIKDMKERLGGNANVIKRTEQYASIMNMITTPQQKAIPPVAALIVLIAGLNIFSIVYLKNMRSQKINGIYKSIGYTTWHLVASNLWYVAIVAVFTVLVTLPISILTYSPIMKLSLSMFHFTEYPMSFHLGHIVFANIGALIIFAASTLASSKALFKVSTRDLVQE